jgi:hypothetical protein
MVVRAMDILNNRYGRLTVIARNGISSNRNAMWLCLCDCGKKVTTSGVSLRKGTTQSCGCYAIEVNTSHGLSRHPLYNVWKNIIDRCYNPKCKAFKNYGNRGITMYYLWREDVAIFISWAIDNGWVQGLEIDRIDNNAGYFPGNCRFVNCSENKLNTRLLMATNSSGYRGVSKLGNRYRAEVEDKNGRHYLGLFMTAKEAAMARDAKVIKLRLHTPLNFT